MSGSLLEVKKKIGGVQNTRKITKAMQLVAASKMRQFQKRALSARSYVTELFKILEANINEGGQNIYTEKREKGKILFVLYTSDKGLCGSLNAKITSSLIRSKKWNDLNEGQKMLITIGKKSQTFAESNKIPVTKHFAGIPEKLSNLDAINVVEKIIDVWKTENIKEVIFIAPHYKNSFTFYPVMKTFLPFSQESIIKNMGIANGEITSEEESIETSKKEDEKSENFFMIFEPSSEHVLDRLYEQIIQAIFIQSFLELKASEYSSRMIAMQNATDSANNMIDDLKRTYNKARQGAITQEIAELIGASMALAD